MRSFGTMTACAASPEHRRVSGAVHPHLRHLPFLWLEGDLGARLSGVRQVAAPFSAPPEPSSKVLAILLPRPPDLRSPRPWPREVVRPPGQLPPACWPNGYLCLKKRVVWGINQK